jgi:hypothetical protein
MYPGASKSIASQIEVTRSQLKSLHQSLDEMHARGRPKKGSGPLC